MAHKTFVQNRTWDFYIISIWLNASVPALNKCLDSSRKNGFRLRVHWCTICYTSLSEQKVFLPNAFFSSLKTRKSLRALLCCNKTPARRSPAFLTRIQDVSLTDVPLLKFKDFKISLKIPALTEQNHTWLVMWHDAMMSNFHMWF